jgi:type I restriction enzyme R subunit
VRNAYNQNQTYKTELPGLFVYNAFCVVSNGLEARVGTITADFERFAPWRTIDGLTLAAKGSLELATLIGGMLDRRRLLDLVRRFIVFEEDERGNVIKKLASYHQYHAVNKAVEQAVRAAGSGGDKRVGVVWHTQGSGKSLSMAFYAGKIIAHPAMENPTLIVLTDRNDLDDQLFGTFAACRDLLRQTPVQAESRVIRVHSCSLVGYS